ncbi:MAG: alkaline phosphatase family protein [Sphaerochaeta sp.]
MKYPDYTTSITNLACSVLKYHGVKDVKHSTLPQLDLILNEKRPKNVVIMLFDGMGISIINRFLHNNSFIKRHTVKTLSSTFPPTTTAATTSVNSGMTPMETGWLGWFSYFKEVDENVVTFSSVRQSDGETKPCDYNLAYTLLPYKTLSAQISETEPEIKCMDVAPFNVNPWDKTVISSSVRKSCDIVLDAVREKGRHMIYCYWPEPDHSMHEFGVDSPKIEPLMKEINENLKNLSHKLPKDTLVIATADHSQINAKWFYLSDYPDVSGLMIRPFAMEGRAASLFVKPGMREEFKRNFLNHFKEHFILMSHEEFMESGLLGPGSPHPRTEGFVGDFVAIATDEYSLANEHKEFDLIGMHAGLTKEEMEIPLIIL